MPTKTAGTSLSQRLRAAEKRPDAARAFALVRRRFLAGQRIEMQEIAAELGVNRATLFRWLGGRNELLAEVLWSLAEPTLATVVEQTPGRGGPRIATILSRFAESLIHAEYFRTFLQRDPERALQILTTRASPVQQRVISAVEALLQKEISQQHLTPVLPAHDLAYLLVRVAETFIYSDLITGDAPDASKVKQAVAAILK